jgi:hypothetical protein
MRSLKLLSHLWVKMGHKGIIVQALTDVTLHVAAMLVS